MVKELERAHGAEGDRSAAPVAKKGGGGLIKMIIVLVILGIAAVAGWFALPMILPAPANEKAEEQAKAASNSGKGENEVLYDPENPPGVIEFPDPFLIRLRKPPGLMRGEVYLKLNLTLEVGSLEVQGEMASNEAVMSRISDTVITFIASKFPEEVETPSWGKLKEDLKAMINSQFPEKYHITRVNFREFVIQSR